MKMKAVVTAIAFGMWSGKYTRLIRYRAEDGSWAWIPSEASYAQEIDLGAGEDDSCDEHRHA